MAESITREKFIELVTKDLIEGTTLAWPVLRQLADEAYHGNIITEPLSDAVLGGAEPVWAAIVGRAHQILTSGADIILSE